MELHAIVHGHVQGVCFRATALKHANRLSILGTVMNLADGTVEIYAQASENSLKDFLALLQKEPGYGSVASIEQSIYEAEHAFESFKIIYPS